ncbi:YrhK family protein [Agrococcus sp. ProA11]|uniref:YrhK family protein n=1 Tax=Agrococcus chionoecetis TaxID=3153752 RepID=UPI003261C7BC
MSSPNQQQPPGDDIGPDDFAMRLGREEIIIRDRYEALSIANDALIGVLFLAGSILFLWEETATIAAWLFIVGSAEFVLRPVIRLARRTHLKRFGPGVGRSDDQSDF